MPQALEPDVMPTEHEELEVHAELERVVERVQKIQRAIKASRQPASMLEIRELRNLGLAYTRLVERLANLQQGAGE